MTPQQVFDHFKGYYFFSRQTGMSQSSLWNWMQWGFVPFNSQRKLEKLTQGVLKAELENGFRDV